MSQIDYHDSFVFLAGTWSVEKTMIELYSIQVVKVQHLGMQFMQCISRCAHNNMYCTTACIKQLSPFWRYHYMHWKGSAVYYGEGSLTWQNRALRQVTNRNAYTRIYWIVSTELQIYVICRYLRAVVCNKSMHTYSATYLQVNVYACSSSIFGGNTYMCEMCQINQVLDKPGVG